jgi:hypothetical protein
MKSFSAALIFFSCFYLCADVYPNFPKSRRITLRHIESGGVGYNNGYTTLEAFLSADPSWKVTPFFDGRGHLFDDGRWAANGGIGVRSQFGERIYGINAYYDYRGTKHFHYNQASIGFETLGALVDARINGYLPFCKKTSSPYDTQFGYFSGHYLYLSQKVEFAMKGIDAEVGFHLGSCDSWNFQANTGPYYFRGPEGPNAWGGKLRASISYQDWVTFEVVESYDNVFHNNIQGQIGFSIPLGKRDKGRRTEKLYCRKLQPVARSEIIVVHHKHEYPIAINPETGSPYFFVFVNNTSSSQGTFESPYPSLLQAEQNSAPHQIIYTFPGDGTTRNMDQGIVLQPSQKFWGSGVAHPLMTAQGLISVPQMSASAPQITNSTLLGAGATLSSQNEISGITFTQTSGQAIYGVDPIEISISSCTFDNCGLGDLGLYPITLLASSPLTATIGSSLFTNNPDAGVIIKLFPGASSTHVTASNNQAYNNPANSGNVGLLNIEARGAVGSCELVMADNIFQNNECGLCNIIDFDSPHDGSFTTFQGTFTGNTCTEATNAPAITFGTNADTCILTIKNNNFSNNTHGSLFVKAGDGGTQFINNTVLLIDSNQLNYGGNAGDAIAIRSGGETISITLTNNLMSNNLGSGYASYFDLPGPNTTLLISDNIVTNNQNGQSNASGGISVDRFQSLTATITGNTLSNNMQGSSIGKNNDSMYLPNTSSVTFKNNQLTEGDTFEFYFYGDDPATGCLTIRGNTSTTDPAYIFSKGGTGSCFIVPCNYETENTGGFDALDATASTNCSGSACP